MGNQQCCSPSQSVQALVSYDFVMGEDNLEGEIDHQGDIDCHHPQIRKNLLSCSIKLKQSRKMFKDKQMSSASVLLKSTAGDSEVRCTYQRPYVFLEDKEAIRGKKYRVVDALGHRPQQIVVKDVIMQSLGVFLCFLSQHPLLVFQVVSTQPNNYGIAVIQTHSQGNSNFVYIDDYILCCDRKPLFTQPIEGMYMWPCLIEKAWLKIKKSMQHNIHKSSPTEVFQTFLSYPLKTYNLSQNKDECKLLLARTIHAMKPGMGCFVTSKKEPGHKLGLSGRQHFYLLKTFQLQGVKMYYLRNPSGSFDFRGTYHIIEPALRQKLQKQTGLSQAAEGDFLLDEQEFIQQIDQVSIIHYNKKSDVISTTSLSLDVEVEQYVRLEIKEKTSVVSISLVQHQPSHAITYQILRLRDMVLVSGMKNEEGCFGLPCISLLDEPFTELLSGEYLIRLKKKYNSSSKQQPNPLYGDLLIVTASNSPILTPFSDPTEAKTLFTEYLTRRGQTHLLSNPPNNPLQIDAHHIAFELADLIVLYVEKKNPSKQEINIQVWFPELTNLKCISHPIGRDYSVIKNISESVVIVFEKTDLAGETAMSKYVIEPF